MNNISNFLTSDFKLKKYKNKDIKFIIIRDC